MFCREQVAQLRGVVEQIRERGAQLVVVGNGSVAQAASFAKERELDFSLLTDPGRRSYKAAGLMRNIVSTFNPFFLKAAGRAMKNGHRQGTVQGDPWQQGGAFVFAPGNEVLFAQISKAAGDHAEPSDLVSALPAAGS